jgi:hypothetical protein
MISKGITGSKMEVLYHIKPKFGGISPDFLPLHRPYVGTSKVVPQIGFKWCF